MRIGITLLLATFLIPTTAQAKGPSEGEHGMVVSAHPAASEAGLNVLKASGNAVDAAVATAFAIAVVEPYGSGLGGGGFAVLWKDQTPSSLDFREKAPSASHRDMFLTEGKVDPDKSRTGPFAVGVPGMVQGLWELHQKHGSIPWPDLLAPAIRLAEDGFLVNAVLSEHIQKNLERFNPPARAIFCPKGTPLPIGSRLVQADLAQTLRTLAKDGAVAFYKGEIAKRIAGSVQDAGGLLTLEDMEKYHTRWRDPVKGTYRGTRIFSMPPPSSGGIHLMQMLGILENYDLKKWGYQSANSVHLLAEVMKFAFADRSQWLGDPDFFDVPRERLLSKAHLDEIQGRIQMDSAIPSSEIEGAPTPPEGADTTHLSVIDRHGNAVSSTLTINLSFGSAMVAKGTGIVLNDEMDDFAAAPGAPNAFGLLGSEANAVAPGKRPLSSMTPTIVTQNGKVLIVAGSPGGSRIITTTLQVILHLLDFDMNVRQAVSLPRVHHQWYPKDLSIEPYGMSPDTLRILEERGHSLSMSKFMGNAQVIFVDPKTNIRYGSSDPRGVGAARGY